MNDYAILGGFSIIHQFCRVGHYSFSAMGSVISKDIPPYVMVSGHPAKPHGLNSEGLKRKGFSSEQILEIKSAYKILYQSNLRLEDAIQELKSNFASSTDINILIDFLLSNKRSIVR